MDPSTAVAICLAIAAWAKAVSPALELADKPLPLGTQRIGVIGHLDRPCHLAGHWSRMVELLRNSVLCRCLI